MARFLALGDSYTIGEGVLPAERWAVQLAARLAAEGFAVEPPEIIAATGWTTAELAVAINGSDAVGPYDLVSLLIGVNNQYRGLPVGAYATEFESLLGTATEFAGQARRVIVLSIPDWAVAPFAEGRDRPRIAREVDGFNAAARAVCDRIGVRFIDVTSVSREAGGEAAMLAADGLHPSGPMYRRWAELALPAARAALARGGVLTTS